MLARTPVVLAIVVPAAELPLLALVLAPPRRQVEAGHAATVIRIVGIIWAIAVAIASNGFAAEVAAPVDPLLAPPRRQEEAGHAATVIRIVGIIWAIAVAIASNGFVPEAAAPADEVRKSLRLGGVLWDSSPTSSLSAK